MNAVGKFMSCEPLENKFVSTECMQCIARTFDKFRYSHFCDWPDLKGFWFTTHFKKPFLSRTKATVAA